VVWADLTGVWRSDDQTTYYLRQIGNELSWYGEDSSSTSRANIYWAEIRGDTIQGKWVDVPKGSLMGSGSLTLKIKHNGNVLLAEQKTGGIGGSRWIRVGYNPVSAPAPKPTPTTTQAPTLTPISAPAATKAPDSTPKPVSATTQATALDPKPDPASKSEPVTEKVPAAILKPASASKKAPVSTPMPTPVAIISLNEDCVGFNNANAKIARINGRWKIVDGSHWMFDFGSKMHEARRALRVIKHYRLNRSCFVGRPGPSFTYMKRGDQVPVGPLPGEDCVGFATADAKVALINRRWKIVESSRWMYDFADKEREARKSLAIIKQYGFNMSCFVGRPNPSFSYLRR
jgi:hypothetical protein